MPKRRKQVRRRGDPSPQKKPTSLTQEDGVFKKNLWSFSWADADGSWRLSDIDDTAVSLRQVLHDLEGLAPGELKRHGCHSIEVSNLSRGAQKRLEEIGKDDLDKLYSLRLTGRERLWAIRRRAIDNDGYYHVFKLLWWDPNHEVCPANPR